MKSRRASSARSVRGSNTTPSGAGGLTKGANGGAAGARTRGVAAGTRAARGVLLLPTKHGVFQGLGDAEPDDPLGGNLEGLARLRIAAHPRGAVAEDQLAQVRNLEPILGFLDGERGEIFEHSRHLLLRQRRLGGEVRDDVLLFHRLFHYNVL